jgi:hypothetical protein
MKGRSSLALVAACGGTELAICINLPGKIPRLERRATPRVQCKSFTPISGIRPGCIVYFPFLS